MADSPRVSRGHMAVLLFFVVLALLATWPLVLHFNDLVPGWAVADNYEYLWKMWWFKHTLLETRQNLLSALHGRDIAPRRQREALNSEVGKRMSPRICL